MAFALGPRPRAFGVFFAAGADANAAAARPNESKVYSSFNRDPTVKAPEGLYLGMIHSAMPVMLSRSMRYVLDDAALLCRTRWRCRR
jgi:hypothetical protein